MSTATTFSIEYHRVIDPDGTAVSALPAVAEQPDKLKELYRWMVLTRTFDAKSVSLQRTGRLGTYASSLGQEAVSVVVGSAMEPEDLLLPSFREQGAQLVRGVTMVELLLYWGGDERGSNFAGPREDFPICIPVASHAPHAAGVALAFKLREEARVAVCVLGDGATSKGDFYEAMNFAGVWQLPLIFVVNNNQWAISVSRERQTAAKTLAQKAVAAGLPGEQVDGNDAIALHDRLTNAIERARRGDGPTVLESMTYRLSDHTTADDASRYRSSEEVSRRWSEDPIARLRTYLTKKDWWDKADEENLLADCQEQVEAAVEHYLASDVRPSSSMFDCLFESLPESLRPQVTTLEGHDRQEEQSAYG